MGKTAYLLLENGMLFTGKSFGAERTATGELVFSTSMVGYPETLTDSVFYGQLVCQTFPLIGNYGVIPSDIKEKKPALSGYIVREWCQEPSNFRMEGDLDAFLFANEIPGIYGIDTRELTRILRENGSMNALLTTDASLFSAAEELHIFKVSRSVETLSCKAVEHYGEGRRIALWDFGETSNLINELTTRGCEVVRVSYSSTADEITALNPCGVVLSDGAGDPNDYAKLTTQVRLLMERGIPMLGVGFGHPLMALARGANVTKMKQGHNGAQPVKSLQSGRVYITAQNHGYCVTALPDGVEVTYRNVNDGSCEGARYSALVFSVQFRPATANSPQSTGFVFDEFIKLTEVPRCR